MGKIGNIGLYPELVEWLLRFFLHDSKSNYDDLLRKAEAVNEKRINAIIWDRSFGLCGFAGKELKFFPYKLLFHGLNLYNLKCSAMIDISIIMPVYNEDKYLHAAIDSILSQTFDNFEFIIIDDASTDNSLQIIKSYTDKRIILICNEYNVGNYPSRNKGLEIAVGKYICVMDADDVAYPQRLELQYQYLEACSDLWILGTGLDFSIPGMKWTLPSS